MASKSTSFHVALQWFPLRTPVNRTEQAAKLGVRQRADSIEDSKKASHLTQASAALNSWTAMASLRGHRRVTDLGVRDLPA